MSFEVPARIRSGIAALATIPDVVATEDPTFDGKTRLWTVPFSVEVPSPSAFIPKVTQWIARVESTYPFGAINVYPALVGGITATFPHQNPNVDPLGRRIQGKLCLDSPYGRRLLAAHGREPLDDADERLAWHVRRTRTWVDAASRDVLVDDSDPFEIPRVISTGIRFVYDESQETLPSWTGLEGHWGRVKFASLPGVPNTVVATAFVTERRAPIRKSKRFDVGKVVGVGIWWLWPKYIVIPPWQPVTTWRELREVGRAQGVSVDSVLRAAADLGREKGQVIVMLGYRMPRAWGGPFVEIHWDVLRLPEFSKSPPHGQRPTPKAWWRRDRVEVFHDDKPLPYANAENWHPSRLQARGSLPEPFPNLKLAVIGCGALGSRVAELLIRAGITRLLLIDGETFVAGNTVRHVLGLESLGQNKARALARVLRLVSPLLRVDAHETALPSDPKRIHDLLVDADIVLDCTATDEVPLLLSQVRWSIAKWFLSVSFGYRARRLFVFRCFQNEFPNEEFISKLRPWMALERRRWSNSGETSEGVGCYSPLFPARVDDIAAGSATVATFVEDTVLRASVADELVVLDSTPPYVGFRRVFLDDQEPHV